MRILVRSRRAPGWGYIAEARFVGGRFRGLPPPWYTKTYTAHTIYADDAEGLAVAKAKKFRDRATWKGAKEVPA